MISYDAYKVIHILGIMFLFISLGAYLMLSMNQSEIGKKLAAFTHGLALLIIIAAGFGLLVRLGYTGTDWPLWIWIKLFVWIIMAGILVLIKRSPGSARVLWFLIPVLGAIAAYMAVYKPEF